MNPKLFTAPQTGEIIRIPRDPVTGNEYAFVPSDLPPDWEFPARLWPLLADAKQQLGTLEGIGRTLPNPGILLRTLENREAIKSSQLEGTFVTATELLVYEMQPKESKSENDPANRQREVYNYRRALNQASTTNLPLSLRLIRELHATLMSGVRGRDRTPGQFRHFQVAIGTDHRFVPPPPERLMDCLAPLEINFHTKGSKYDHLIDCCLIHYQFETIHPFGDGNGRIGRLLFAIMLKHLCGLSKPWLYISEYYEQHREEYIQKLFNVSTSAAWEEWVEFCLIGIASQARDTVQRCAKLQSLKERFMERINQVGGQVRLTRIVEDLFQSPFVQIAELRNRLNVSYPTAKADVERLVQAEILSEMEGVSPRTYYAPEVFTVAYEKME